MRAIDVITVTYGESVGAHRMLASLTRSMRDGSTRTFWSASVVVQPDDTGFRTQFDGIGDDVQLIDVDKNLGFAAANNLAVEQSGSEYLAFLNPDLELTEGWLEPLTKALDDPAVAIAAPVLLTNEGRIDEAGQAVFSDGSSVAIGGAEWPCDEPRHSIMFDRDVDYASAACWVMRRSTFIELGGFSNDYWPAYFEDNDFGQRVQQAGFVTRLVTASPVVHHREGASADRRAIAERSRATFERNWAARLKAKPARELLDSDLRRVRDHLCSMHHVEHVTTETIDEFARAAAVDPRNRYTAIVPESMSIWPLQKRYAASGLEIVTSS